MAAALPPGEAPPEWEKAKQALAAIQQPKKLKKIEQEPNGEENAFEKYGGPIGYPPGFNVMYPGYAPPGPGFG